MVADTSTWIAQAAPDQDSLSPSAARAAGLLHDLGLLWLVDQLPEITQQAMTLSRQDAKLSLGQALSELAGIDHRQAGRLLAEAWKLPEPLVMAMINWPDFR